MQVQRTQNTPSYRPAFEKLDVDWQSLENAGRKVKLGVDIALTPPVQGLKSNISQIGERYDVKIHGTSNLGGMVKYMVSPLNQGNTFNGAFGIEGLSAENIALKLEQGIVKLYKQF